MNHRTHVNDAGDQEPREIPDLVIFGEPTLELSFIKYPDEIKDASRLTRNNVLHGDNSRLAGVQMVVVASGKATNLLRSRAPLYFSAEAI